MRQIDLARATGIGVRTIGRLERDVGDDPRSYDAVEAYLGIVEETPLRVESPRLNEATDAELVGELFMRLQRLTGRQDGDGELPPDIEIEKDVIFGPEVDPRRGKRPASDG